MDEYRWSRFKSIYSDICGVDLCRKVFVSINYVFHQAAIESSLRSVNVPLANNLKYFSSSRICWLLRMIVVKHVEIFDLSKSLFMQIDFLLLLKII